MPRPYSNDLRERVVRAYLDGRGTYREVGEQFNVGEATVDRWVSRFRRLAKVEPDAMGGDRNGKFDEQSEALLRALIEATPDIRRDELVVALRDQAGLVVSPSAVQRAIERLGLTRKKRLSMPRNAIPNA